jgi:uncharacterized protein YgiM (DUF1202 family)
LNAARLVPVTLGLLLLTSCSFFGKKPETKASSGASLSEAASDKPNLTFPQANCGEEATTPSANWYPVYLDNADLSEVRSRYCGNAVNAVRAKTGTPTVQLASFTSYEKAQKFAEAVGGTVDPVSDSTAAAGSTTASRQDLSSKTGVLTAAETGAQINIRTSASIDSAVQDIGFSGDKVQVISKSQGDDGQTWYRVQLSTGATGWVRSDLVTPADTAIASSRTGATAPDTSEPSATASTSPSTSASTGASTAASAPPSTTSSTESTTPSAVAAAAATSAGAGSSTSRTALVTAQDPDSPINVRSSASTSAEVQDLAYAGDRIQIADRTQGDDGHTWYRVKFESGAEGWIRSDFVGN